jgi:hypothetical protein
MIYKKTSQQVGANATDLPTEKNKGINGSFTNVNKP